MSTIIAQRTTGLGSKLLPRQQDYILWATKDIEKIKYHQLFKEKILTTDELSTYRFFQNDDGTVRKLTDEEKNDLSKIADPSKLFTIGDLTKPGPGRKYPVEVNGKIFNPGSRWWGVTEDGMKKLIEKGRIYELSNSIGYKRFYFDFPYTSDTNFWTDTGGAGTAQKLYVVQTNPLMIQKCMLMTTDPGDLVLDITCGSGTTAFVAEQWGRRWITCDTSRIALTLAKQRLMTSLFDFYELSYPNEGVGSGFKYKSYPHTTLKSIANSTQPEMEVFYDKPIVNKSKYRITGPFTVEAVPAPMAKTFDDISDESIQNSDVSVARSGETLRQEDWRQELFRAGVRAKGGNLIEFTRVEPLLGSKYLQAEAETREDIPKRVVVCFGPEHAPLEQRMVELALDEARTLKPKPDIILFCAFHFDPEARKDIEETNWPGMTLLEAQMNADLLTEDLKKKRSSNESFWLIGQPDVSVKHITSGEDSGKITVEVLGFDYYNPKSGSVDSGGKGDIAMWMLDHDYDGRSLLPSQVFFPMAGAKEGWATLAKNLKAEIDDDKIEAFNGTVSLPFKPGNNIAVKIIDARGIESLKIIRL